jgi:hypothetical protein
MSTRTTNAPQKALVDVEEMDVQTLSVPLSISGIISGVDAALRGLGNKLVRPDPTDREGLMALAEFCDQAARSLLSAGARLHELAALLRAAGLLAYHRAPLPKSKSSGRRSRR